MVGISSVRWCSLFVCLFGQVHHEYMERSKASKKGLSVVFFSKKRSFFI